jgi:hypothetical protein
MLLIFLARDVADARLESILKQLAGDLRDSNVYRVVMAMVTLPFWAILKPAKLITYSPRLR